MTRTELFCLRSLLRLRQVSPRQFDGVLQSIAVGIEISNFLLAFFHGVFKNFHHLNQ